MAGYGEEPLELPVTWRVAFVDGPWDGNGGRYFGLEGFPEMITIGGRYVFRRLADDGEVVYRFRED